MTGATNSSFALGAVSRTLPVPGLSEYGRVQRPPRRDRPPQPHPPELEAADQAAAAAAAPRLRVRRRRLRGRRGLAELNDLARDAIRYYPRSESSRSAGCSSRRRPRSFPELPPRLANDAAELLERRGDQDTNTTRSIRSSRPRNPLRRHAHPDEYRRLDGWGGAPTALSERACRRRQGTGPRGLPPPRRGPETTWALGDHARVPRTPPPRRPTRRPASTPSPRRAASRRTSTATQPTLPDDRQGVTLGRYKGIAEVFGVRLPGSSAGW